MQNLVTKFIGLPHLIILSKVEKINGLNFFLKLSIFEFFSMLTNFFYCKHINVIHQKQVFYGHVYKANFFMHIVTCNH